MGACPVHGRCFLVGPSWLIRPGDPPWSACPGRLVLVVRLVRSHLELPASDEEITMILRVALYLVDYLGILPKLSLESLSEALDTSPKRRIPPRGVESLSEASSPSPNPGITLRSDERRCCHQPKSAPRATGARTVLVRNGQPDSSGRDRRSPDRARRAQMTARQDEGGSCSRQPAPRAASRTD